MEIVRYRRAGTAEVGVRDGDRITPLPGATVAGLLRDGLRLPAGGPPFAAADATPLAPLDERMEVWAAGVTYRRSQRARMAESERSADVYERVYDAPRPELFFKSAAWRVRGDGEPVAVRADSTWDVPEPELALVLAPDAAVAGYTICNDVSSRSIEGENPLYLPQAKTYLGACATGPGIRPAAEVPDPYALGIGMTITRGGAVIWSGTASTAELHRRLDDLVDYLFRADAFPDGVVLSTGTCLVPDPPFTLTAGDTVTITIDGVGVLTNPVIRGRADLPAPPAKPAP